VYISTQKQPSCKKGATHAKKDSMKKEGGSPEVVVMVG